MKFRRLSVLGLVILLTIGSAVLAVPQGAPATRPSSPSSRPSVRNAEEQSRRLRGLTRQAIEQIKGGRLEVAERTLKRALEIEPASPTNLYNLACVKSLQGESDAALDLLERSASAGFVDFIHMNRDPDLRAIRELPRYRKLLERKDEFQRQAAEQALKWLKRQFGEEYIYEIDVKNKLIFATNTDERTLEALRKNLVAQAEAQWKDLFAHKPEQYVSVVLPSVEDFKEIVSQPGVGGFYNHSNRILICQRLGQVMTHEFTHALHNADQDPTGQEHAIWLTEGLATLYEAAQFEGEGEQRKLVPADNFRLPFLQRGARMKRLIPLDRLIKMDQKPFVSNATYAYGQAGSLLLYLHEQGQLRKFYEEYKETFDQDSSGKIALESVTGKPLAQLEKDWLAWMVQRKGPPMNTGVDGPVLGVRFGEANDGLMIDEMVVGGPAERDGIKVGDVVVGINDTEVRDQQSLIPLLAGLKPGDEVAVQVRRGDQYVTVPVKLAKRGETLTRPTTRPSTRPASRR